MSVKVTFRNKWIVPGFGRNRFPIGYVDDVPEALREILPKSAELHPDDYSPPDDTQGHEDAAARKYAEEQAKAVATVTAMNASGLNGFADETDPSVGPQPDHKPGLQEPLPVAKPALEPEPEPVVEGLKKPTRAQKKGKN